MFKKKSNLFIKNHIPSAFRISVGNRRINHILIVKPPTCNGKIVIIAVFIPNINIYIIIFYYIL